MPVFPLLSWLNRRLYSRYNITRIGNGEFIYFPSIPEFIIRKKTKQDVTIDIRPVLRRRNIRFIEGMVTNIQDGGRTVITEDGNRKS